MGVSGVITELSSVWMPFLLKLETDQLVEQKSLQILEHDFWAFEVFMIILWIILIVKIIERILSSINSIFSRSQKNLLENEIQLALFREMQNMEIGRSMSSRYKYISSIIESNFSNIATTITEIPQNTIQFCIQLIWMTAIYAYFDIRLLFIVVISAIIGYVVEILSRKASEKYGISWRFSLERETWKYSRLFMNKFSELAVSGWLLSTLQKYAFVLWEENKNALKKDFSGLFWDMQFLINGSLRDIVLKLIVWYGVFAGTNSVWMVVLVVSSMRTLWDLVSQIFHFRTSYKDFVFAQESVLLILKICVPVGNITYWKAIEQITFQDVSFSYPNLASYEQEYIQIVQKNLIGKTLWDKRIDREIQWLIDTIEEDATITYPEIFSDINMHLERGKVYGIVGKNGAGKTSLMYLLSGFYRWYTGNIWFNGEKSQDFTTASFLNKISFLTQTPFMLNWNATIREELFLWADSSISEWLLWEYLEKFGLAQKIKKHKKWLDAEIGNDIEFSWWEKQMIAFIRLLLQNRDVVIMDEGTNQLDAENEILVMNELLKQKHNKIIIFVTHRMSTIARADLIYCLENGKISASGTHSELLEKENNAYARFYRAQVL